MSVKLSRHPKKIVEDINSDLSTISIDDVVFETIKTATNLKKIRKTNELIWMNEQFSATDNLVSKNGEQEVKKTLSDESTLEKRKIIKAKRHLKCSDSLYNHDLRQEYNKTAKRRQSCNNAAPCQNESNFNELSANTTTATERKFELDDELTELSLNKQEIFISQGKKGDDSSMYVTTLLNPISPSGNNSEYCNSSFHRKHFNFDCSEEELYPSTSGVIETSTINKRWTYELDNSVNDVSLLKAISDKECIQMNASSADTFLTDSKPPIDVKFSKVTLRRKWDKLDNDLSYLSNKSPIWMNTGMRKTLAKQSTPIMVKTPESLSQKKSAKKLYDSMPNKCVKIPNFSLIHQKALNKVESIAEYKQRKENRAKMLLSGKKPCTAPTNKENKKYLRFAADTLYKEQCSTFIPLPSTPMPKCRIMKTPQPERCRNFKINNSSNDQMVLQESQMNAAFCQQKIKVKDKKIVTSKNIDESTKFDKVKFNLPSKYEKVEKIFENKCFNLENSNLSNKELHNNKQICFGSGFNLKVNKPNIKNDFKTIVKNKSVKNTIESRRFAIKGVRSNRRFELLMNMRKGK
ncbi:unnamed protein product [Tenebrio molitor]|nr:unnamed protein product [Tenebrio molitor]